MDIPGRAPPAAGLSDPRTARCGPGVPFGGGAVVASVAYAAQMAWTFWRVYTLAVTATLLGWVGLTTVVQQLGHP